MLSIKKNTALPFFALLRTSLLSALIFGHIEVLFVFGLLKDFTKYSDKLILSIPFIQSIILSDFLIIFPAMFICGTALIIYQEKNNDISINNLTAFIVALFFMLSFGLRCYLLAKTPLSIIILLITSSMLLFICHYVFKDFNCDFSWFIFSVAIISCVHFLTEKTSFYKLLPSYSVLLFILIASARYAAQDARIRSGFNKKFLILFLSLVVLEWFMVFHWSNRERNIEVHPVKTTTRNKKPNIILIVADTLRADACNTPQISSFANKATVYKNCTTTSPWTLPAHASLFTGTYVTTHRTHFRILDSVTSTKEFLKLGIPISYPLKPEKITIAKLLKQKGYKTYGIASNYVFMGSSTGIAQGFDTYDNRHYRLAFSYTPLAEDLSKIVGISALIKFLCNISEFTECKLQYMKKAYRMAEDINKSLKHTIKNHLSEHKKKPFFLFVNYMDTHEPYIPLLAYRKKNKKIKDKWLSLPTSYWWDKRVDKGLKANKEELEHIKAVYNAGVMYTDTEFGKLIKFLKSYGIYDNTMIIFTADHGEFNGEHDLIGHGTNHLYKQAINVPLIIKYNGTNKGKTVLEKTSIVDIFPTILTSLKMSIPSYMEGYTLTEPTKLKDRYRIAECYEYDKWVVAEQNWGGTTRSISQYNYKLILNKIRGDELFDTESDPEEKHNIIKEKIDIAKKMKMSLEKWLKKKKKSFKKENERARKLDKEELNKLKSLGYL